MDRDVKVYSLSDSQQAIDEKRYWKRQSIEFKIGVLESLREDAIKLGLYPDSHEAKQRLRRVLRITEQK